jgi:putative membrane protein
VLTYALAAVALALYTWVARAFERRRKRPWSRLRSTLFVVGVVSVPFTIEGPLDAAADARFAPHMIQHLLLTDLSAPLLLLGAPLLLCLGALPTRMARRFVAALRTRTMHVVTFPVVTWIAFIGSLWVIHFSGFYEAALDHESLHILEHAIFLSTALLFWLPVIVVGPVPWTMGALAYPLRMLYLFLAMPAESLLGFVIFSSPRPLYVHYAGGGVSDQQFAGEIMWIGAGFVMFVAFMAIGAEWARESERRDRRDAQRNVGATIGAAAAPQR